MLKVSGISDKLNKYSFFKNILIVASGTAGAQALTFIFSPILTRIYTPEAFGVLGAFVALYTVISPLSALSYPIAIVLPKEDDEAIGLMKLSFFISLVSSITILGVLYIIGDDVTFFLNLEELSGLIYLLPFVAVLSALLSIISHWVIRKSEFDVKAKGAIIQSGVFNVTKALGGIVSSSALTLVIITSLANLMHVGILLKLIKTIPSLRKMLRTKVTYFTLIFKYKDFAKYRTPQIFITNIGENFPVLILAWLFNPAVSGFYALSRMVLLVPTTLLGQSVADVFYNKYVDEINNGGNGNKILFYSCAFLFLLGIIPYSVIYMYGPELFSLIFGKDWLEAGIYAKWLSLWLVAVLISKPISFAIPVLSLQRMYLIFEILSMLFRFISMYIGYLVWGTAIATVISFSISSMISYTLLIAFVFYKQREL